MKRIVVIGAGIAGLVAARRLVQAGADVTVLEAGPIPGGHARTVEHEGFRLEWGPHTLTGKAVTLLAEAEALNLPTDRPQGPGTRYIWRSGRLHALPDSPLGLLRSRALSVGGWLRVLAEPFVPARPVEGESVADFFTRRIGGEASKILVGSFVSGIHAGDPDTLCAEEAFPGPVAWEREHGSLFRGMLSAPRSPGARGLVALRGGMGALTGAMAASLGPRLLASMPVTRLSRGQRWTVETASATFPAEALVLAVPPNVAARLLAPIAPDVGRSLSEIPMSPLALVHFGGRDPEGRAPRGFGALIPRGEGVRTLGVLFVGSQMPDRMPDPGCWLHAAFVGGATDPGVLGESDEAIAAIAVGDSAKITGFDARPTFTRVVRHPAAIPQLQRGHHERVALAAGRFDDLVLAGNWVRGVSAEEAAVSGVLAAEAILERGDARRSA